MQSRCFIVAGFTMIFLFSGCALLFKERTVKSRGLIKEDLGLPLVLYRSQRLLSSRLIVLLSGDGGWLTLNDSLATKFSRAGFDVIGFNCRSYFWQQKSPEQVAGDFTDLLRKYLALWKDKRIVLSGYSFGADVVPFLYNGLPADLRSKVEVLQLLSPFLSTDFKVYLTDLINMGGDDRKYKVKDEVKKITIPVYCFYGEDEDPKPLADLRMDNFHVQLLPGDHHYTGGSSQILMTAGHREIFHREKSKIAVRQAKE